MTIKPIYSLTILLILLHLTAFSQTTVLNEIDKELTRSFDNFKNSPNEQIRMDILAPKFKRDMLTYLANPITFDNALDSLSNCITIRSSADKKVKFYSWDKLEGGSWHSMETLAQFISGTGKIVVQCVSIGEQGQEITYTDSQIYEVNEFSVDSTKYYLTFGWGTHGSGMQHNIIQVFQIAGDSLIKCTSCFTNGRDLVVEYPRVDKLTISYNSKTNEIKYNEVLLFEDNRFLGRPTKNIVTLVLEKGAFKAK